MARSPTPHSPLPTPVIALIAGEDSGDALGADLIKALRKRYPQARLLGIGGPRMAAAGFEAWHDIGELSVMGLAEVLRHLPRLLRLRRRLGQRLLELRPDVVVGIDAPDFNLGLEKRLKRAGIRTAHYVSPSVWAWREGRALKLGASADRVLCLLPMEPPIYARHNIDARFVGHPLATQFARHPDRAAARATLGLPGDAPILAVLPGSRGAEIDMLGAIFLDAAQRVASQIPGLRVIVPAANDRCFSRLERLLAIQRQGADTGDAPVGVAGPGTGDRGPRKAEATASGVANELPISDPEASNTSPPQDITQPQSSGETSAPSGSTGPQSPVPGPETPSTIPPQDITQPRSSRETSAPSSSTGPQSPVPGPATSSTILPQDITQQQRPGETNTPSSSTGPQSPVPGPTLLKGHARDTLIAADIVLVASGTAALETMLAKRPMVVAYRIAPLTYRLIRLLRMMKTSVYSLPNVLAGRALVSELMQDACNADALAQALLSLYADHERRDAMASEFDRLHTQLLGGLDGDPADHAAAAIADLLEPAHGI